MPVQNLLPGEFAITESSLGPISQGPAITGAPSVTFATGAGNTVTMHVNIAVTFTSPQVNNTPDTVAIDSAIDSCSVCNTGEVFSALVDVQTQLSGELTIVDLSFKVASKKGKFGAAAELRDIATRLSAILQKMQ